MNAVTRYFGEVSYEQKDILHLPDGLFGFESEKRYLLIHFNENDGILLCLQSLENPELAFVLVSPFHVLADYSPEPSSEDMAALQLGADSEVSFYAICVIRDRLEDSTVNLKCPIIINTESRTARQIILEDAALSFKHPFRNADAGDGRGEKHC